MTPQLTPDTSSTPLTPFRGRHFGIAIIYSDLGQYVLVESPYRYRESNAQDLSGQIHKQSEWPAAHGGYADIWKAQWERDGGPPLHVCIFFSAFLLLPLIYQFINRWP